MAEGRADVAELKQVFGQYPNIVLMMELIELRQRTNPKDKGIGAHLRVNLIPTDVHLEPVVTINAGEVWLALSFETFGKLARAVPNTPQEHVRWLDIICRMLSVTIAADGPRA